MDINANLTEQLGIANLIIKGERDTDIDAHIGASYRLAELVLAQHEWFRNYGFLPEAWKENNPDTLLLKQISLDIMGRPDVPELLELVRKVLIERNIVKTKLSRVREVLMDLTRSDSLAMKESAQGLLEEIGISSLDDVEED